MKYSKSVSLLLMLTVLLTVLIVPLPNSTIKPASGIEFSDNWDYYGILQKQEYRIKHIPVFSENYTQITDPNKIRTFIFLLDNVDDTDEDIDTIIALYGLNDIRSAPYYSFFFEDADVAAKSGTEYGFNVSQESGMEWIDIDYDSPIVNASLPEYNENVSFIYERIKSKTIQYGFLYDGLDLQYTVHLAMFTTQTGVVGHWQMVKVDKTIINGNFTTYGADYPLFVGPTHNPYPEEQWWPQFNVTVPQNVERTSRPRSHTMGLDYPFFAVIASLGIVITTMLTLKRLRRNKR